MFLKTFKSFLACITLGMYLIVGTLVVRLISNESSSFYFSTSYSNLFSPTELKSEEIEKIESPSFAFSEIKFIEPSKTQKLPKVIKPVVLISRSKSKSDTVVSPKNELPFQEAVVLSSVHIENELESNLVSLYREFRIEAVASNDQHEDSINTTVSASTISDAEPEFFDYPKNRTEEKEVSTNPQYVNSEENVEAVDNVDKVEEVVNVEDLVAFDYSKAKADIKAEVLPKVSKATTQQTNSVSFASAPYKEVSDYPKVANSVQVEKNVTTHTPRENQKTENNDDKKGDDTKKVITQTYPHTMTIQVTGTNLKSISKELGFELRYQDDVNDIRQDYNSGAITIVENLASPKMTRSVTLLKRGFAPTNTDLIMEEGETKLSLPAIDEDTFNLLLAPYESLGPIGAVLVELEEKTEGATLDVPYSKVIKLNEKMKVTNSDDYSYELFVGVKAGNALLSYKDHKGKITSKIIHIHERELTFESNFYEDVSNEDIELLEEGLLAKDKMPLVISSEDVKEFAANKSSKKIKNNTYQMDYQRTLLGSRRYMELSHQSEPVFIGFKDNQSIEVPSEDFMRFILSKFEDSKLGNRCLVQVNLTKKAVKVDVSSESVGSSVQTSTQILDSDGSFYDSISEKSRKIIIVGDNAGNQDSSMDSKINVKVTYEDGSTQYLGSYCSPNTYLVEQL